MRRRFFPFFFSFPPLVVPEASALASPTRWAISISISAGRSRRLDAGGGGAPNESHSRGGGGVNIVSAAKSSRSDDDDDAIGALVALLLAEGGGVSLLLLLLLEEGRSMSTAIGIGMQEAK
jgi:hypothetical protein